jgi:hypothetical protein
MAASDELFENARRGRAAAIAEQLAKKDLHHLDVNEMRACGTPLHEACRGRHVAAARVLLESGADPNAASGDTTHHRTPLACSVSWVEEYEVEERARAHELVSLLLSHGAVPDDACILDAVFQSNEDAVRRLLPLVKTGDVSRLVHFMGDNPNVFVTPQLADFVNAQYARPEPSAEADARADAGAVDDDDTVLTRFSNHPDVGRGSHETLQRACVIAKLDDPSTPLFERTDQLVRVLLRQQRENRQLRRTVADLERMTPHLQEAICMLAARAPGRVGGDV